MSFWLHVGGIFLGALSLFRLITTYYQIGLAPILEKAIEFYNNTIIFALGKILDLLAFVGLPAPNPHVIVVLMATLFIVTRALHRDNYKLSTPQKMYAFLWLVIFSYVDSFFVEIYGLWLLIVFVGLILVSPLTHLLVSKICDKLGFKTRTLPLATYYSEVLFLGGAVLTLFALNFA